MSYSPVVYPNAATMSSSAVHHHTYLPDDGTMDDGHYMDVEEPLSTAATYRK